jgi:hypothetical protein
VSHPSDEIRFAICGAKVEPQCAHLKPAGCNAGIAWGCMCRAPAAGSLFQTAEGGTYASACATLDW